jgi:hypothetical protein
MRTDDNIENHMVLNTPDAPWNQPDAPEESAAERMERERIEARNELVSAFVDGLNALADWYEKHPEIPLPMWDGSVILDAFVPGAPELAEAARALGHAEKHYGDKWFTVRCHFGPISLEFNAKRANVCRRVVVGTSYIPEKVIPATTIPAHTEEIVEWDCPDSLLSAGHDSAGAA